MTVDARTVRLQKVLARAGVASRRECERLIELGHVRIDGEVVRGQGVRVDPAKCRIECDGTLIRPQKKVYYLLNKPRGVVCSNSDEFGRTGAIELLPDRQSRSRRLNTVGRLDKDSEGLIIITNDGKLTDLLTHPRYHVRKTYHVRVSGRVTPEELKKLRRGTRIAEGEVKPSRIRIHHVGSGNTMLEVELADGRNRAIRRMLAAVGHPVRRLKRVAIGPISDNSLKSGKSRKLTREEVSALFRDGWHVQAKLGRGRSRPTEDR